MIQWIKSHRYCLAGLYLFVFLGGFFLMERLVPEPEYVISCPIDDWIPFCEWFVLPYFLWYLWVPALMLIFMFRDRDAYLRLCLIMFSGATLCLVIYALWPNGLNLRREITSDNFCADIVRFLRWVDTPNNVCPSIHVSSTVAVHQAVCGSALLGKNRRVRALSFAVMFLIGISTMFIKQHSIIDVVCGWALSAGIAAAGDRLIWPGLVAVRKRDGFLEAVKTAGSGRRAAGDQI